MTEHVKALQRPGDFFSGEDIAGLRDVSAWRAWWGIFHCWGVILGVWIVVSLWTNPLTILLGVMIVGTRQLGLGVLAHDAAHYTLFRDRSLNDWVAEWLFNRPLLGGTIDGYRKVHLAHHRFTQQPGDPDLGLSKPFPIPRSSLKRKLMRDLTGQTGIAQYGAQLKAAFRGQSTAERMRNGWWRLGRNILVNMVLFGAFVVSGEWYLYFLLWWVPALTWNRWVTRLRNIAEHAAVPDDDDRLRNTRTTTANLLERAFIAPYRVNYHLEHHLLVSCPFYRLPRMHRMLIERGLGPAMEVRHGYLDMLRHVVTA